MPRVTIDFFRVHFADPNYQGTFEDLLEGIMARPAAERSVQIAGGWNHFHRLTSSPRRLAGDVLRVRADQIPPAADMEGRLEDLGLDPDQGIAAVTYFYYRRSNRVLLLLRSPGGLSGPGLEHLVQKITDVAIELRPVPQLEILEKLRRLRNVKKLEFKLSTPDPEQHALAGRGVVGLFDLMAEFDAHVVEVRLAAGRKRDVFLNRSRTVRFGERLLRLGQRSSEVEKAKVHGLDPAEERTLALDLLHGRMVVQTEVEVGPNRWLDDASCIGALERAYNTKSADLAELYGGAE